MGNAFIKASCFVANWNKAESVFTCNSPSPLQAFYCCSTQNVIYSVDITFYRHSVENKLCILSLVAGIMLEFSWKQLLLF